MAVTPPEIAQYLQQLEPILTRWYIDGKLGEVATIFGPTEIQAEERPKKRTVKVRRGKPLVRTKAIEVAR